MTRTVLVAGATGFHGSAVLRALARRSDVAPIGMVRAPSTAVPGARIAELEDPRALAAAVDGVDVVVHCAPYIGYDEGACRRVNVEGTARLVAAASAVGAGVLYLSTTGVYGHAARHGVAARDVVPAAASVLSASRAEAERIVLGAGGGVLRPHLVVGRGDTRVLPTLRRIRELLGGLPRGGAAAVSAIAVDDLGRLVAGLAAQGTGGPGEPGELDGPVGAGGPVGFGGLVGHAVAPAPTTIARLLELVGRDPGVSVDPADAAARLAAAGLPSSVAAMSTTDEVYDAEDVWERAGVAAPSTVALTPDDVDWYRSR